MFGQRLPQLPLFAIGLTMILVLTAFPPKDKRASLISTADQINRKEKYFAVATKAWGRRRKKQLQAAEQSLQEKNAIFSAWLMRRIGASGSLAGTAGFGGTCRSR